MRLRDGLVGGCFRALGGLVLLTFSWGISAAAAPAGSPQAADPQEALRMVRDTAQRVIGILQARREELAADPALLNAMVEHEILPYFDFVRMSRLVLGKYWRRASREERRQFVTEFRQMLVHSYASSMLKYSQEKITYLPLRATPGAREVTVRSEVELPGMEPVGVEYSLHFRNGQWKVYDVAIDGVSLVVNYRTSFAQEIRRSGGLAGLIEKLRRRNAQVNVQPDAHG